LKNKLMKSAALVAALALGGLGMAQDLRAQEMDVTIVAGHPPVFRRVKHASQTFIPAVNAALEGTGYSINRSEQYGGALARVGEELETVEEGLAEIGLVSSLFDPAKLAVQNITCFTPFVSRDSTAVAEWMDALRESNPDIKAAWEENGLQYLGGAIGIDDYLLMTTFPVNSISDLAGRKIVAPGPVVNWLKGTGAVGVSGNLTSYCNEIKAGVYDEVIVFASAALPGKLHEVAPHITKVMLIPPGLLLILFGLLTEQSVGDLFIAGVLSGLLPAGFGAFVASADIGYWGIILSYVALMVPVLAGMQVDLVWFGIVTIMAVEIGLLTPPFGISVFVIKSALDDPTISLGDIFVGAPPLR
jgi:TRAP-type C4-dicarboxylate transport system substrate-binding protein